MRESKTLKAGIAAGAMLLAAPAWAVPADFKAKADAYLKSAYAADGPGVAVIVVDDGRVAYAAGQGLADMDAKRQITPGTVFRMGSITKQFTAAIILQLAAEGKLSLSDPLSKFVPDYPRPGADATITQLLNHTSGIKSYTGIPGWMKEENTARAHSTQQMIAQFKDQPADFAGGAEFRYNNSGYVLLGAVIEKVAGKPWHAVVDERIVRPLSLKTIRYGDFESSTPGMAVGYTEVGDTVVPSKKIHMSVPHAAGALIGSVEDLATWAEALHKGKVVPPAMYKQMIAPTKLADGEVEKYGFGLSQGEVRGRDTIQHGGGIFGFGTASAYIPKDDLFVAVFTNTDEAKVSPSMTLEKLAAMAVGDPFPEFEKAAVPHSAIEALLGLYEYKGGNRRFYAKDGRLFTRLSGGRDMEAFPAGNDRFFYGPQTLSWFEVKRDSTGKHVMGMHQGGSDEMMTSVRSGPVPADAPMVSLARPVLERYVGSYKASRGIMVVAMADGGGLTMQLGGGRPIPLQATSQTEFRTDGFDSKVVFHSGAGKVSHLVLHQGVRETRADRQPDAG